MTRLKAIAASVVLSLTLAACAGPNVSVLQGGGSLTAPIANPVSKSDLAAVEASYGVVVSAAVNYRRLPLCAKGEKASIYRLCAERKVILALQKADRKAYAALTTARNFVRDYPTLSALQVLGAASAAVNDFRNEAYANGVR